MKHVPHSYLTRFFQLAALWAYAVSQHVFSLLDANPEFLVVRGATRTELAVFATTLAFGLPALAVACERIASILRPAVGRVLHLVFLGVFALPLGIYLVGQLGPEYAGALIGAVAIALAIVNAYAFWRPVGLFLAFSFVLPAVGFASLLWAAPLPADDAPGANPDLGSRPPVVMLVLDEFPVSSLMDPRGEIDRLRYPNFARLARDGTWYPRATTTHEHTTGAVPAILSGRLPHGLPTLQDHPENLFTLLGSAYRFRVHEQATQLCPRRYCEKSREPLLDRLEDLLQDVRIAYAHRVLPDSMSARLPPIGDRWGGFTTAELLRAARDDADVNRILTRPNKPSADPVDAFLRGLSANGPATLHFLHVFLPHSPWRYLPSGRQYGQAELVDGAADSWNQWGDDPRLVQEAYQRHLLQVGYTDRLLGELIGRLEAEALYERALLVVVADHGASFVPGGTRRTVSHANLADIGRVPLFIKLPRQAEGRIDRRSVQTIDIVPTLVDVLGVDIEWTFDGQSLLGHRRRPSTVSVFKPDGTSIQATAAEVDAAQTVTLRRKARLFGAGGDSLFRLGTNTDLLGRRVASIPTDVAHEAQVQFDGELLLARVRKASMFVPARITGFIDGLDLPADGELAVAVNGRIAALSGISRLNEKIRFSALVPESSLRDGNNEAALYLIADKGRRLVELGRTGTRSELILAADGRSIRLPDGARATVNDHILGRIERWETVDGTLRMRGWAVDRDARSLPDQIIVFAGQRSVYTSETTVFRWDIESGDGLERSGWTADIPEYEVRGRAIRVFALRDGQASELTRSESVEAES